MKKLSIVCLAVVMAVAFGYGSAFATQPSAKATAQLGDLSVVDVSGSAAGLNLAEEGIPVNDTDVNSGDTGWVTLFTQNIKTPTGKDLFINVSLECGLTTDTTVMSKKLARAIAEAEAVVKVRVKVDGNLVPVNGNTPPDTDITFAKRNQKLIAEFAGDFSDCMTTNLDTGVVTVDWTCADLEMLQLILDTMQANSFNFIVPDLLADTHTVQIQAKLSYLASGNLVQETIDDAIVTMAEGKAFARAYLGNGSVTVEVVRMIQNEDVVIDLILPE